MSLYQRPGSPFWYFDFTVNGERFRGSTGEESKREARKVEDDHKQSARRKGQQPKEWTVHRMVAAYYDERGQNAASNDTILHQLGKLEDLIGKDRRLMTITNSTVMDYRARRRGDGLQQHSINREVTLLRSAMRWVHKMHKAPVPDLEWKELHTPEPIGRQRYLSFDEWDTLLAAADPRIKPILICAVFTGLRKGNILTLEWAQVRLDARRIYMQVKGNKAHSVRIPLQLLAALSTVAPADRRGRVFDTVNFQKLWLGTVKRSGLTDLRFHDLRHTFASWARQNGADIADVKESLGHSDISMTMRYAHIKPESEDTAFDKVSRALAAHSASQQRQKREI